MPAGSSCRALFAWRRVKRGDEVEAAAFLNPDGSRVAILHRKSGKGPVTIALDGERYTVALPEGSVATLRWSARSRRPVTAADPGRRRTFLAFAAVTTLFFAWGFITSNNDPLIVALRAAFHLDYTEALLTQIVFFLAYGLLSLPAAWLTSRIGAGRHDPRLARR